MVFSHVYLLKMILQISLFSLFLYLSLSVCLPIMLQSFATIPLSLSITVGIFTCLPFEDNNTNISFLSLSLSLPLCVATYHAAVYRNNTSLSLSLLAFSHVFLLKIIIQISLFTFFLHFSLSLCLPIMLQSIATIPFSLSSTTLFPALVDEPKMLYFLLLTYFVVQCLCCDFVSWRHHGCKILLFCLDQVS